jgi:hypothetical protein
MKNLSKGIKRPRLGNIVLCDTPGPIGMKHRGGRDDLDTLFFK